MSAVTIRAQYGPFVINSREEIGRPSTTLAPAGSAPSPRTNRPRNYS